MGGNNYINERGLVWGPAGEVRAHDNTNNSDTFLSAKSISYGQHYWWAGNGKNGQGISGQVMSTCVTS